ncbi:hypothetical protein GCM10010406_21090 [Streptomyces thermolineatus]|uniref:HK97 gp10 family phage protein n=1 Tax=Streptomyces thermolineatus TaxID=44033 RepID=A0ABN3LIB7_9ACTN
MQHAQALASNERAAARQMRAVVTRGALNVKRDWQAGAVATARRHARLYPASVSYDVTPLPGGATAEIGPDKGRPQGALGNLLEFGSVHNPPHNDGGRALLAEEPRFAAQAAQVAARGMRL